MDTNAMEQAALYRLLIWIEEFQRRNKLSENEPLTLGDLRDIVRDAVSNRWVR